MAAAEGGALAAGAGRWQAGGVLRRRYFMHRDDGTAERRSGEGRTSRCRGLGARVALLLLPFGAQGTRKGARAGLDGKFRWQAETAAMAMYKVVEQRGAVGGGIDDLPWTQTLPLHVLEKWDPAARGGAEARSRLGEPVRQLASRGPGWTSPVAAGRPCRGRWGQLSPVRGVHGGPRSGPARIQDPRIPLFL